MSSVRVRLPDGSERQVPTGSTYKDVALSIGAGLAKAALAAKENGKLIDLTRPVSDGAQLEIITAKNTEGLEVIRHSTAHVLAMAVQKLWPGTQVTIGPVIEHGFYYDFLFPNDVRINDKDLETIEQEMTAIVKADLAVKRDVLTREQALDRFEKLGEQFKCEIIR